MNWLNYLVALYESDSNSDVNSIFVKALKESEISELSKSEIVELKRQLLNYIGISEELNNSEARFETIKECKPQTFGFYVEKDLKDYTRNRRQRQAHKKYIEAFISNISVPKTLQELDTYYLDGNDAQILVKDILSTGMTNWSVPRWVKWGDVVLFMHAKMARTSLTRLRTETNALPDWTIDADLKKKRLHAISDQLEFHKKYGGKIYAVGRVNGKPEVEEVPPGLHFRAKVFCDIDDLFLLDEPIDLSEFSDFIKLSSMSAVTPVFGEPFEKLKQIIISKNDVPPYFKNCYSTPFPHNSVNERNWMQLGLEYRFSFSLEIQFRQCYVDYLLKEIGDQKTIYMECSCYKDTNPVTYVDNIIWFNQKLLPVEVKLNIKSETNLEGQCEQYCNLDRLILNKKTNREAKMQYVIKDRVLIIDTFAVYMFDLNDRKIHFLYDLDELRSEFGLGELKETIVKALERYQLS